MGGTDSISITVSQPPTVDAGANSSACAGSTFTVLGDTATNHTALLWTTSGTGTFSSNTSFSPTYTPSLADIPAVPSDLCINSTNSYYTAVGATHALTYQWFIKPTNAGQITSNNNTATIDWNNSFYGNVELSVLGVNLCGVGDTSNSLNIEIHLLPVVDLGNDTTICKTQTITIDAGFGFASYLWSTGDTTQTITVDSLMGSGTYSVTVTDSFSCTNSDNIIITFDPCVGFAELSQKLEIKIYPNPSKGIFKITTKGTNKDFQIKVYNIKGQEIQNQLVHQQENIILDLSSHPKGVYFVRLWNESFVCVGKVVLQ